MKKIYTIILGLGLALTGMAQQKFELGKPNDDNYRYLDDYAPLKDYVNREKYPNFRMGLATIVSDYLNNSTWQKLISNNANETVAGNAMKMASCVDGNGNMNFTSVKNFINRATSKGLEVYGHTLAWHSQQPKGWLLSLLQGKKDPNGQAVETTLYQKDLCTDQTVGWTSDKNTYGFTISFDKTNGMKVNTKKKCTNFWDVQFIAADNIKLTVGKSYKLYITAKGSKAGQMHGKVGDWNGGAATNFSFTTEWKEYAITIKPTVASSFLLLQCGDFVGDVYIKNVRIDGDDIPLVPLTAQEKHDTLVYAMDKWIKGMMTACNGKVKAWDLVNEAISGDGNDGSGYYELQHSDGYKSGTWDVGGDAFYWQDYMGDLEYVRQACRLARKYGPEDVKLFINDYNLESTWDGNKKLKSLINWIKKWEADGVTKIDGIGTQMHISYILDAGQQQNQKNAITNMFKLMAASGKLVRISEFDMGICKKQFEAAIKTENVTEAQHKKMAEYYEWIVKEYLRLIPADQQWGICLWCPTDAPSNSGWRGGEPVGLWDRNYYRKHTYAGVVRGLGGVATAIDEVEAVAPAAKKGIYDLLGRRYADGTDLSSLPAGIYIVDGKKVVRK